ncbi:protein of unknown function [Ruminococcaceae bacterium BL-6]|nr:protein of unknown function [Ruminococcaceae bacterium BL-6]
MILENLRYIIKLESKSKTCFILRINTTAVYTALTRGTKDRHFHPQPTLNVSLVLR